MLKMHRRLFLLSATMLAPIGLSACSPGQDAKLEELKARLLTRAKSVSAKITKLVSDKLGNISLAADLVAKVQANDAQIQASTDLVVVAKTYGEQLISALKGIVSLAEKVPVIAPYASAIGTAIDILDRVFALIDDPADDKKVAEIGNPVRMDTARLNRQRLSMT